MSITFAGFVPPVDDYFRMPNEWINICAEIDNLAELKIIQYVLRHTWGYQEYDGIRKITIDEFMYGRKRKDGTRIDKGTGLSKQSVITGVERAIEHGFLVCQKDDKDSARKKRYYHLNMRSDVKDLDISDVKDLDIDLKTDVKDLDPDVKQLDSRGLESRQRTEKDTIERHLEKDTVCEPPTLITPAREDTHPSFINSSSSREQVADRAAPTPQARSRAEAATSAPDAPRTPVSPPVLPQGVRGVFPQDDNVVGSPPAENKAQVNPSKKPGWKALLDYWDSKYGASPRPKWVEDEAKDMIERMKPTPEQVDKVCAELKARHKPVTFETMYNNWHLLKEVEEREKAQMQPQTPGPIGVSGLPRIVASKARPQVIPPVRRAERNR